MTHDEREEALYDRIATAVERCAERLGDRDRITQLEQLLEGFVALMNDHATDEAWLQLLADVQEALA